MEAVKIIAIVAFLCVATVHQADAQYYYASYPYFASSYYYPSYVAYPYTPYMIGKRSVKFRSLKEGLNKGATDE
uniref:Uncharacterized protein n=1 Tax=Plectus sambesii TaxID=2011161 RepID=A0A914WU19_9BILA